jgi:ribosome-associated protein
VLLDYGDVIVHLFEEEERDYYDIEGLWRERANVLLSIQ